MGNYLVALHFEFFSCLNFIVCSSKFFLLLNICLSMCCQVKELVNETRNARYKPIPVIFLFPFVTSSVECDITFITIVSLKGPGRVSEAPSSPAQSKRPRKLKATDL